MVGVIRLPDKFLDHAAAFVDGRQEPAEPRNAATVVLTRRGQEGIEVYLLRRQASMEFAGGVFVFPGGGVDPRDFDTTTAWAGPSPEAWARLLGVDQATAHGLVCAAVRETFEESGVLLAGASADVVVADTTGDDWEEDRRALEARELAFTDFLNRRGLVMRTDLLGAWSGWLTPIFEPRRYRTWFFVAELPEGQRTRDVSTESDHVVWLPAIDAVTRAEAREVLMLPPTYLTCLEVAQYPDPDALLAAAPPRPVEMFCPAVTSDEDGVRLSSPDFAPALLATRSDAATGEMS